MPRLPRHQITSNGRDNSRSKPSLRCANEDAQKTAAGLRRKMEKRKSRSFEQSEVEDEVQKSKKGTTLSYDFLLANGGGQLGNKLRTTKKRVLWRSHHGSCDIR
jgi:hypothetical protein